MNDAAGRQDAKAGAGLASSGRYPLGFYLALAANFAFFSSFQWTYAALPGYVQSIGGDLVDVGLATGVFALSAVLVRPAVGWLVDRWGRRPPLIGGAALFALAPALYAAIASVAPFLAVRAVHGVGIAAFTTAYTALVVDLVPVQRRGEALGLTGVAANLGLLFMPALGLAVQSRWGYAAHWLLSAGLGAEGLLLALTLPDVRGPRTKPRSTPSWRVARLRPVWVSSLGGTGLAVAYGAALSFMAPLAAARGLTTAGAYFSAFAVTMMAVQPAAGWLSDRAGRRAVAAPGLALTVVAAIALAAARTDVALLASGAVLGASWGLVRAGIDPGAVDAVGGEQRGTAVGVLYTCFDAGVGAGAYGLGLAAQAWGYAAAFYLVAAWAAVALAVYGALGPGRKGADAPQ